MDELHVAGVNDQQRGVWSQHSFEVQVISAHRVAKARDRSGDYAYKGQARIQFVCYYPADISMLFKARWKLENILVCFSHVAKCSAMHDLNSV
eukprot:scaffold94618_cov34-Prasinocladus_malaysianus.AAC.1